MGRGSILDDLGQSLALASGQLRRVDHDAGNVGGGIVEVAASSRTSCSTLGVRKKSPKKRDTDEMLLHRSRDGKTSTALAPGIQLQLTNLL